MHRFLGRIFLALSYLFLFLVLAVVSIGGGDFVLNGTSVNVRPAIVQFGRPS